MYSNEPNCTVSKFFLNQHTTTKIILVISSPTKNTILEDILLKCLPKKLNINLLSIENDNDNELFILAYGSIKTVFNDRFLKIKTFVVMEITLGHKYFGMQLPPKNFSSVLISVRLRKGWPFFAYDQWCCGKIIQKGTLKFEILS